MSDFGLINSPSHLLVLQLLVETIVDQFSKFEDEIDAEVFDALREQQEKSYRNYCLKPSKLIK